MQTQKVISVLEGKKYFIFDLDDTLSEYSRSHCQGLFEIVKEFSPGDISLYGSLVSMFDSMGKTDSETRRFIFKENLPGDKFRDIDQVYWKGNGDTVVFFDEVDDALMNLFEMGNKLSIVTNGGDSQRRKIHQIEKNIIPGFYDFDYKIVTGDYGREKYKPNPYCLEKVVKMYGAASEECIYIGDNLVLDGEMAYSAGVDFILIDRFEKYNVDDVTTIKDLTELI